MTDGAEAAGARVTTLRVPANLDGDATGTAEAIKSELLGGPSIDAVMNLASADAVSQIGGQQMIGTFGMNPAVLARIQAGTQTMAIDQQPYMQGFLATSMLFADLKFGTEIATDPVLTGPAIVFKVFDRKRANEIGVEQVGKFGITRITDGDRLVGGLSGGERQSLAIAVPSGTFTTETRDRRTSTAGPNRWRLT